MWAKQRPPTRGGVWYITPQDIRDFTICPMKLRLKRKYSPPIKPGEFIADRWQYHNAETVNSTFETFKDTVKIILTYVQRRDRWPTWNSVRTSLGIAMKYRAKLQLSIPTDVTNLIKLLQNFHESGIKLLDRPQNFYVNFPILFPIGKTASNLGLVYADILHGVGISEKGYTLLDFTFLPKEVETYRPLNTLAAAARLWGFVEAAKAQPYKLLTLGTWQGSAVSDGVLRHHSFFPSSAKELSVAKQREILYIMRGCLYEVSYRSQSNDCRICQYYEQCQKEDC